MVKSQTNKDEPSKALELNVKILKVVGLWPWQEGKNGWRYHLRYYYPRATLLSASLVLLSQILDAVMGEGHMTHVTENVYVSIVVVLAMSKNGTLLYRSSDVERLVHAMQDLNKRDYIHDKKQLAIHNQYQWYSKMLTKGFMGMIFVTVLNFTLGPLTKHDEPFPMPHRSYFPFDHTVQPYYFAAYFWQAATTVSDGFLIGVCDTLFVSMLINAIGQYKQLQYKLETMREFAVKKIAEQMEEDGVKAAMDPFAHRLDNLQIMQPLQESKDIRKERDVKEPQWVDHVAKNSTKRGQFQDMGEAKGKEDADEIRKTMKMKENEINFEMERYISNVVEHHQGIMNIIDELESVFGPVLFYQFFASLTFFCMTAFHVTKMTHIDARFIVLMQMLTSSITELLMFCWFSTTLTDESTRVNEALYFCDWTRASPSFKKSMQIIWMRTNKPISINAAGFVPVSLELFRSVIKTSYSFYTLLAQLDTPAHHHHTLVDA